MEYVYRVGIIALLMSACTTVVGSNSTVATSTLDQKRLVRDLLQDYDPMVRPVINIETTVTVSIRMTLHQIRELDEKNQHLITNVWLRFFWKDEFLKWEPEKYNGIKRLHIRSSKIWRPDIVLYNSVDEERTAAELMSDTNIELSPDGAVSWTTPAMFKSACKIEIDSYPFDVQRCPLKFGPWTYNGFEVNVTSFKQEVLMDNFITNGEWEMVEAPCVRNEVSYSCCPEPYPDVTCTFIMRRRPLFYIYNLVVPCLLLIFVGSLVFCLPPESGEKVSLAMTVLLAMTVFMLVVMENIPPTSEVVPLLEQFIGATIVLLTLSAMTAIFTVNFYFKGTYDDVCQGIRRPAPWIRCLILDYMARAVLLKRHVTTTSCIKRGAKETRNGENGCVHLLGCTSRDTEASGQKGDMSPREMDELIPKLSSRGDENSSCAGYLATETHEILHRIYVRIDQISVKLLSSQDCDSEEDKAKKEWRSVSLVLDRVFFVVFVLLVVFTCGGIFSQVPGY